MPTLQQPWSRQQPAVFRGHLLPRVSPAGRGLLGACDHSALRSGYLTAPGVLHAPQTLSTARSPRCGRSPWETGSGSSTQLSSLGFSTLALLTLTLTKQGLCLVDGQHRAGPVPS